MLTERYSVSGTGHPVLLLHSSMSSKSQWKDLAKTLERTHQVIAIDLLGYGASPLPENKADYTLSDEARHIDLILNDINSATDQQIEIIGHSFGGATALHWAYANQNRVKALHLFEPVAFHLLDPPCAGRDQLEGVITTLKDLLTKNDPQNATRTFIDYWSGPGTFLSFPPHIQQAMVGQIEKVDLDFQALSNEPCKVEDYQKFPFPITLIMGSQSPASSQAVACKLRDHLPQIDFHQIDCGHMGPITHPHLVNEIFLSKVVGVRG
jgi:pimeloyl-ACP methyl ester carboxylesterase